MNDTDRNSLGNERPFVPGDAVPLDARDRRGLTAHMDAMAPRMSALARAIWERPELAFQEFETSRALRGALEAEGFVVRAGVADLPTAFIATSGAGKGPVIAFLAEMDALPGFSQAATPRRQPIEGKDAGHACGHHLFGVGAVGAAIALHRWIMETGVEGEVRVYGTPAEEGGAGKAVMARAGLFNDVDVAFHWHPDDRNAVWQSRSLASIGAIFRFHGKSAHAAGAPERGRSALHGVEAFHHMASLMREVVPPMTHIHYVVSDGGRIPNVIPDFAESRVGVRHPDSETARLIFERVEAAARGAAMGTGTEVTVERVGAVHSILPNDTLGKIMYANMLVAPPIVWNDEERAFAEAIRETMDEPPAPLSTTNILPYRFGTLGAFSSDVGDVSWITPCAALGTVTWVPGTRPHTWQAVAAGGTSIADKGTRAAAITLAATAANLLRRPELIARARAEFAEARGGNFVYRSLMDDDAPTAPRR